MNELEQLKQRVAQLETTLKAFTSDTTIPFPVGAAFKKRLGINELQRAVLDITDDFPADPLSQDVNEAGTSSYKVMAAPDYALKLYLKEHNLSVAIPGFDY